MKLAPYHVAIVIIALMFVLVTPGLVSADVGMAVIQVLMGGAPIIGIVENFRKKQAWGRDTTVTISVGLYVVGWFMFTLGLQVTAVTVWISATTFGVLALQTFWYERRNTNSVRRH